MKNFRSGAMTLYEKLIDLKYRKGVSTFKLTRQFPGHRRKIHEVALMGVEQKALRKTVKEKALLKKILSLKKKYPLPRPATSGSWLTRLCRGFSFSL